MGTSVSGEEAVEGKAVALKGIYAGLGDGSGFVTSFTDKIANGWIPVTVRVGEMEYGLATEILEDFFTVEDFAARLVRGDGREAGMRQRVGTNFETGALPLENFFA